MTKDVKNQSNDVPPYVSYATFSNAISSFAEHGVPAQIDRSVLGRLSGGVQRHLIAAFRFMGLIDDDNRPTDELRQYAKGDTKTRQKILTEILRSRYDRQLEILHDGTIQQLTSSFDNVKAKQSVKAKCITFFLKAARDAGFPVSPHIESGTRLRAIRKEAPRKRKKAVKKKKIDEELEDTSEIQGFEGLVPLPISLGPNKVWYIQVEEEYGKDDVEKFTKMIGIALSKE
ncbi:MAG: DUF5343 domain-containing protein [bacterium]|nr:DUF5343 domain-containing protein [bacterium]